MIYKEHLIELWVNGNKVELEDQKSVSMRFNNVLFDPTKISSNQAEYSFEFEVPATKKNNVIFDYANNLSKLNKFHQRYNAEVYADGTVIFSGTITINGFKDNKYSLNLVSVKVYSLDEIFGDMTMNQIKDWKITFNGVQTINTLNGAPNPDVVFPLVSYGVFQKDPYQSDDIASDYTSKYDIDEWSRFYVEDFYPSHNMLVTLKKAFESKGYKVGGDVFNHPYLKDIYMSVNLADEQSPDYNVGNPRFGKADVNVTFTSSYGKAYGQELNFPYFQAYNPRAEGGPETNYNWTSIDVFSTLMDGTVTSNQSPSYMYHPHNGIIVIPADGWYKIELSASTVIDTTSAITAAQHIIDMNTSESSYEDITMDVGIGEVTPIEIQLVRNYDDNIELIKGKKNRRYVNGNCTEEYYYISTVFRRENIVDWLTCFPHEDPYSANLPTEENDLKTRNKKSRLGGNRSDGASSSSGSYSSGNNDTSESGNFSGRRGTRGGTIDPTGGGRNYSPLDYGYVYNDGEIMCFDQAVTDTFICGLSSLSNGVAAVMKNGYSWSPITAEKNEIFAPVIGYSMASREAGSGNIVYTQTKHNENSYINTPIIGRCNITNNSMNGSVSCMVWLNKNDKLELMAIQRGYEDSVGNKVTYTSTTNAHLVIEAFSNRSQNQLLASHDNRYEATIEFDERLNLPNFFNKDKKISEWIQNVIDAYNLEVIQNGNTVEINTKKKANADMIAAVEMDDRANSANAEAKVIDYPKTMAVKYKIDADEWGFEQSAENTIMADNSITDKDSILNDEDAWKEYGDSGYTIIKLNDDTYETSNSDKSLQFSYTWYQNFNWYAVDSAFTKTSDNAVTLKLPCISKYEYMIDGYSYEESMKHDGYGLAQRFWFRPKGTNCYVWTRTYPTERVMIYEPTNLYTNYQDVYFNLSYKDTENSILTEFFNIKAYLASNFVEIEVYISADEYNRIKNGSLVHFDSDLYIPVEISGYDPSGYNPTTLKLMKKVN